MRQFIAPTEDFIKLERTTLTADATAGASNVSLTLANNNGMSENMFVVIGLEGSEKAEIQKINQAVTVGTGIRVAVLTFNHKAGEPVTVYRYDKRKFYGCATATGTFVELTAEGSPKLIQVDDPQGTLFEYAGDTYSYFKSTYYNSVEAIETDIDDSSAVSGDQTGRYATIYGIRKMAGFTENPFLTDGRVEQKRRQAENEIDSTISVRYVLPLSSVPDLITYVCELLAAGYIHYEEFGKDGDGGSKLGEARAILKKIAEGKQKLLVGDERTELTVATGADMLDGYPSDELDGAGRMFTVTKKF